VLVGGRGSNLEALIRAGVDVVQVVSHRPGVRALAVAAAAGIPAAVVDPARAASRAEWDRALCRQVEEIPCDGVIMAGFLRQVGPPLLERYGERIVNVHPSLLPAFPGLHAVRQALAYGVKITGVTVHFVEAALDQGPIIAQEAVAVVPDDTEDTLTARVQQVEHRLLPAVVRDLDQGRIRRNGRRVWREESECAPW
jgi:phosphoribosylglycinamide formyltransferase-1